MPEHSVDAAYLRFQYGDSEKLRIRQETHARFSEAPDRLVATTLHHLALAHGVSVLDVGCGPGAYHAAIARVTGNLVGLDKSLGMARDARSRRHDEASRVYMVQADAEALPFPDSSFHRVLAVHMLYHVADQHRALREMRRVLRPGGRVVLATNDREYTAQLNELHEKAAIAVGYEPTIGDGSRFTLDDLHLVKSVFPRVDRYVLDNALVFEESEPLLRYYASGPIDRIANRPSDGSHRPKLLALVKTRVEAVIQRDGAFRAAKRTGCFVAHTT